MQPMAVSITLLAEAEYMSVGQAVREALWLRKLLGDLGIKVGTMPIHTDSQGALKVLQHSIASCSNHVDAMHHFAREGVPRLRKEKWLC